VESILLVDPKTELEIKSDLNQHIAIHLQAKTRDAYIEGNWISAGVHQCLRFFKPQVNHQALVAIERDIQLPEAKPRIQIRSGGEIHQQIKAFGTKHFPERFL